MAIPRLRLGLLLALLLLSGTPILANHALSTETFQEQLIFRSLNRGQISAYFQFRTFVPTALDVPYGVNSGQHNDIFPLSLLRLFHQHDVHELHLSLTKGKWKYDLWGLPMRDTPPNAHLSVWFNRYLNAPENWKKVTSFLSGQFCASINLINPTVTIRPKVAFRPFLHRHQANISTAQDFGYLAALPQEAICTENLTPWTKLLPCRNKKGISQLLVASHIFNSQFVSLSLDFKFSCADIANCAATSGIELTQNIVMVFDAPQVLDSRYSWSLNSLFNTPLQSYCPLSSSSHVYIEASHLAAINGSKLVTEPTGYVRLAQKDGQLDISRADTEDATMLPVGGAVYADYDLTQMFERLAQQDSTRRSVINLGIQYPNTFQGRLPAPVDFSTVHVRRHARGFGVSSGGLSVRLTNSLPSDVYAIYLDMIPWHFRMYLHTLVIEVRPLADINGPSRLIKPQWLHYEPAQDRVRPHHLELLLRLPAQSDVEIRFEFDNQFLRWTEYPPDANHGLYINPASVTFFLANHTAHIERFLPHFFEQLGAASSVTDAARRLELLQHFQPLRLFTEPLLIAMPTPDFSMPYNVVCLVSTVLSIAFGPIYNLTTRRTRHIRKVPEKTTPEGEESQNEEKSKKCAVM